MSSLSKEVWLVGKGASADTYNFAGIKGSIIAINEMAFVVPCTHALAMDYSVLDKYRDRPIDPTITVIKKRCHHRYKYEKELLWDRGIEAEILKGSASVAVQILEYYGVEKIHFVGFDSLDGDVDYGKLAKTVSTQDMGYGYGFQKNNEGLMRVIQESSVICYWEHMMKYKVISFYTTDSPYEEEIKNLVSSCEKFGVEIETRGYPNRGKWELNCAIKPEFILDAFENTTKDLLFIDADGVMVSRPLLFEDFKADIGVHYKDGKELISSTIYIKHTKAAHKVLLHWAQAQQHNATWDQKVLQEVLKKLSEEVVVENLPPEYTKILGMMSGVVPIIQQNQASRRFKKMIKTQFENIPNSIGKARIRFSDDGTFWLARKDSAAEKILDKEHIRIKGELKWYPGIVEGKRFIELKNAFEGRVACIIGKGPSLDLIKPDCFESNDVIIALNEATHHFDKIGLKCYGVQQDNRLRGTCGAENATMITSYCCKDYYPDGYIFRPEEFGMRPTALSVLCAIEIAKRLNVTGFRFYAFDANTGGSCEYADSIGYSASLVGDSGRFKEHKSRMIKAIGDLPYQFISLIDQTSPQMSISDTPPQSVEHLQEQNELDHELQHLEP